MSNVRMYIYEPMWSESLEQQLKQSSALPIVEEMFYKYGLKVLGGEPSGQAFFLTLDGPTYCRVGMFNNEWFYYSKFYRKQRGRSDIDRQTLTSIKLSSLMKSLEKNNAVPSSVTEVVRYSISKKVRYQIERGIGRTGKDLWGADVQSVHEALRVFFGEKDKLSVSQHAVAECKKLLDQFNASDDNMRQQKDKIEEFFKDGAYAIGQDYLDGYIIAKISINDDDETIYEGPVQRVKNLTDYEGYKDMAGAVTIIRTYLESEKSRYTFVRADDSFLIPVLDKYFTDLDACCVYDRSPSTFDINWMVISA